mgnify:FL=1
MFAVTRKLDSKIFQGTARRQAFANFVGRQAKEFKSLSKARMIRSKPAGRLYPRRRGANFRRFHRASARGQRPAIDTGKLLNSIEDRRLGEFKAEVFAGAEYAKYLQSERLDRPIMDERDAGEAQAKFDREAVQMIRTLT